MAPPRIPLLFAALLLISRTASALQVTPNSPCAAVCQDQPQFDVSAPKSSNTKNTDIFCKDAFHNGPTESKWKTCMTCLQTSTFAQGSENDMMWFLYNLRYSLSYCVFAYPNATDAGSTPCSTTMACGPLRDSFIHGLTDQKDMSTYSYCQAPNAMDGPHYERCVSCVSAEGKTEILANSVIALEAACLQQPAIGAPLGLNDTIFAPTTLKIVDPLTLVKDSEEKGLSGGAIAGIVGGALAILVIVSAVSFVCYRKRKNRRARADFEAGRNSRFRHRHQSSMSFQCQTHAMSPRFWPGGDEAATPVNDKTDTMPPHPDTAGRRSSLWKPHNSMSSFENTLDTRSEKTWTNSPYQEDLLVEESSDSFSQHLQKQKRLATTTPLHTSNIPALPRNAHMSPNTASYHSPADIRTPMSAESTRSTTALLPGIKPYVPADHGVHFTHNTPAPAPQQPGLLSAFSSPVAASGWADQRRAAPQPQPATTTGTAIGLAISSVPPPSVPWIKAPGKKAAGKKATTGTGTPVESWEVKTSFEVPPPPPKR